MGGVIHYPFVAARGAALDKNLNALWQAI